MMKDEKTWHRAADPPKDKPLRLSHFYEIIGESIIKLFIVNLAFQTCP